MRLLSHLFVPAIAGTEFNMKKAYKSPAIKRIERFTDTIVSLSLALLIAVFVSVCFFADSRAKKTELENMYQKSYYELSGNMINIENKLEKAQVAQTRPMLIRLLNEIWKQSGESESNMAQLPLDNSAIQNTTKFVNQLGDYSNSLSSKLIRGGALTETDRQTLIQLYERCRELNNNLTALGKRIGPSYKISDHIDADSMKKGLISRFGSNFKDVEDNSVEYPKMIYDGPFSDALKTDEYKAIENLPETDNEYAIAYIKNKFGKDTAVNYISIAGDGIKTHELAFRTGDIDYYAQLTVKGCLPLLICSHSASAEATLDEKAAVEKARELVKKLYGFDAECVFVNEKDGVAFMSIVPKQSGVVIYPDMIKLKLNLSDGSLAGLNSMAFIKNNTMRIILAPALSESEARESLNRRLKADYGRLALVPKGNSGEVLCYEFTGEYRGSTYVVFINADDGTEQDIMRIIIDESRGKLLE